MCLGVEGGDSFVVDEREEEEGDGDDDDDDSELFREAMYSGWRDVCTWYKRLNSCIRVTSRAE